ncbi:MAG: hypothetical protein IPJ94_20040 [Chloroflexi bacterium]|nr:hypothetical protein [Chloroflexota bacterium]
MLSTSQPTLPPAAPKPNGALRIGLFFLVLVAIAACAFLLYPSDLFMSPNWVPAVQSQLRAILTVVSPYFGVALLGTVVAIAELASTFPTYPREALRTRWARILVLVNVVAAILALIIARVTVPETNPVLLVIGVGVGFQAIIRTRFVLARAMGTEEGGENEVSLNLGWLYEQFQHLCRTQIDLELMKNRRTPLPKSCNITQPSPSCTTLPITPSSPAPPDARGRKTRIEQLQTLIDPKAPEQFSRNSMALTILENGGPAYVEMLLSQAMTEANGTTPRRALQEKLVWQIINNYSLDGLVELTSILTEDNKVRDWVKQAATTNNNTVEANQKAAIAYFLVQQIGEDRLQQELTPIPGPEPTPNAQAGT